MELDNQCPEVWKVKKMEKILKKNEKILKLIFYLAGPSENGPPKLW